MTTPKKLTPTASQTVGPYFRIGLEYMADRGHQSDANSANLIEICGQVLDANRAPVPDAMLEFWGADASGGYPTANGVRGDSSSGFRRVPTDDGGRFTCRIERPGIVPLVCGVSQAPHLVVLVFARGLLRNLITRVYFPDPEANSLDLVLAQVPEERRYTLIASADTGNPCLLHWNVVLQGPDETAFFAW
jgi:protocatechuate 3,4-dioxygenase alpha subunit